MVKEQEPIDRTRVSFSALLTDVEVPEPDQPHAASGQSPHRSRPPRRRRSVRRNTGGSGRSQNDHLWLLAGAACALLLVLGAGVIG